MENQQPGPAASPRKPEKEVSYGMAALLGGLAGGTGGWFAADELSEMKRFDALNDRQLASSAQDELRRNLLFTAACSTVGVVLFVAGAYAKNKKVREHQQLNKPEENVPPSHAARIAGERRGSARSI